MKSFGTYGLVLCRVFGEGGLQKVEGLSLSHGFPHCDGFCTGCTSHQ